MARLGNRYHNNLHAADVLQTTHWFISQSGLKVILTKQPSEPKKCYKQKRQPTGLFPSMACKPYRTLNEKSEVSSFSHCYHSHYCHFAKLKQGCGSDHFVMKLIWAILMQKSGGKRAGFRLTVKAWKFSKLQIENVKLKDYSSNYSKYQ